ncbi:MAG: hypothetical protein HW387_1368 [Parachlamydiales bacterium]|nr:hypothetical protein [Parachlamydiales bacterium]
MQTVLPYAQPVLPGTFRRRLLGELEAVQQQINHWGLQDEMTVAISRWRQNFVAILNNSRAIPEEEICQSFIAPLQNMLRDPITRAPLDDRAVLGSDGHTYGQNSLDFFRQFNAQEPYRSRSPLHMNCNDYFTTTPHRVVRHMLNWLRQHNALLYSPELEQRIQLQQGREADLAPPSDIRSMGQGVQKIKMEEFGRAIDPQIEEFEQRFLLKLHSWEKKIEEQMQQLPALPIVQPSEQAVALQKRISQIDNKNQQAFQSLQGWLERIARCSQNMKEDADAVLKQEEVTMNGLKERITTQLFQPLEMLRERMGNFAASTVKKIEEIAGKDKEIAEQIQKKADQISKHIEELKQANSELEVVQQRVGFEIEDAKKEKIALSRAILETQIAVAEMEEKAFGGLLTACAIVGVCIFATWAVGSFSAAASSAPRLYMFPTQGHGAGVGIAF